MAFVSLPCGEMRGHTRRAEGLWINHVAGLNPDLSRAITDQVSTGAGFSDPVCEPLFERFFANTRLTVEMAETTETVARELSSVARNCESAGADAGAHDDDTLTISPRTIWSRATRPICAR